MKNKKLLAMTEAAMMVALSLILNFIIVFQMPQGGTVTLGAMVPIIVISLRHGTALGMLTGILSGLLQFLTSGQAFHPLSVLLDYLLAYGILGCAGWLRGSLPKIVTGTTVACLLRFLCHLVSGATLFASYAPKGQNPWLYSVGYNSSYMVLEWLITTVITALFYQYARKLFR